MSARTRNVPTNGRARPVVWGVALLLAAGVPLLIAAGGSGGREDTDDHPGPRDIYNLGTRLLREGKLNEAEATLQSAVASQDPAVQPPALYNLGSVRFQQGMQEYTNSPDSGDIAKTSSRATQHAGDAIKSADEALAGEDTQAILAAYLRARGARKDLRSALEDVQRALDAYGAVLAKWRRSSGDFKSTMELRPPDQEAQTNADIVDGWIVKVVALQQMMMSGHAEMEKKSEQVSDSLGKLNQKKPGESQQPSNSDQQNSQDSGNNQRPSNQPTPGQQGKQEQTQMPGRGEMESLRQQLGGLMRQLKAKLPAEALEQLGKGGGDDEDDDDKPQPKDLKNGQEEGPGKQANQMLLTREEAERLLQLLRDPNRKLSLGGQTEGPAFSDHEGTPATGRKGRDW